MTGVKWFICPDCEKFSTVAMLPAENSLIDVIDVMQDRILH